MWHFSFKGKRLGHLRMGLIWEVLWSLLWYLGHRYSDRISCIWWQNLFLGVKSYLLPLPRLAYRKYCSLCSGFPQKNRVLKHYIWKQMCWWRDRDKNKDLVVAQFLAVVERIFMWFPMVHNLNNFDSLKRCSELITAWHANCSLFFSFLFWVGFVVLFFSPCLLSLSVFPLSQAWNAYTSFPGEAKYKLMSSRTWQTFSPWWDGQWELQG